MQRIYSEQYRIELEEARKKPRHIDGRDLCYPPPLHFADNRVREMISNSRYTYIHQSYHK